MKKTETSWLRLVAILAAAVLVFAACGDDGGNGENGPGGANGDEPAYELVEEGALTVGSDYPYPPFEFEEGGELTGFDVEVVRAVADELGLENTDDHWQSVSFDTIFQQLRTGTKFDIVVAAVTAYAPPGSAAEEVVNERRELVDFTKSYYPSLQSLTVDTEENPDIASVDDVPEGARVGVQRATTGAFYAEENFGDSWELVGFAQAPPIYQQLQAGQLDAVFNDLPVSLDAIKDTPELQVVEQVETGEEYAMAVNKDNPELLQAINDALDTIYENGTYAEIFKKYFPEQELPDFASE
ncbi:MAG: transporter substrate-binding domain-containing protein [Actinomycetota bacterium]|nr:transporter substrate-binding domain-containing protein [Actinomycetota bacterium]